MRSRRIQRDGLIVWQILGRDPARRWEVSAVPEALRNGALRRHIAKMLRDGRAQLR